jgi:hypothetical protein
MAIAGPRAPRDEVVVSTRDGILAPAGDDGHEATRRIRDGDQECAPRLREATLDFGSRRRRTPLPPIVDGRVDVDVDAILRRHVVELLTGAASPRSAPREVPRPLPSA